MANNTSYLRYKFWLTDHINGDAVGSHYCQLSKFYASHYTDSRQMQEKQLYQILAYANKMCSFYDGCNPEDLKSFPVVNKSILIRHHADIALPNNLVPGQVGEIHIQKTSGSTGTPFAIPQDTQKRYRRIAELKYFGQRVGFKSHEPLIHLRTWNRWQSKTPGQIKKENIYPFDIAVLDDKHLGELYELAMRTKAVSLRGYASSLGLLADYIKRNNLPPIPSVAISFSGSEMLLDETRRDIKRYIGGEVISQYANEECGILAQEKVPTKASENIMYLNNASYRFEFLKLEKDEPAAPGELARIVITDLYNHAFPIIRYDTGDTAIFSYPTEKSDGYPVITHLYGRRLDIVYSLSGNPIHPMVFGRTLKHYDKIAQWQFVQNSAESYELRLIMKDESEFDKYIEPILNDLTEVLECDRVNIKCVLVDDIPVLKSGKRKPVVNNWVKK